MFKQGCVMVGLVMLSACAGGMQQAHKPIPAENVDEPAWAIHREHIQEALGVFDANAAHRLAAEWERPRNSEWHHLSGLAYRLQNDSVEAAAAQRRAIELNPTEARYHDYLAGALGAQMQGGGMMRIAQLSRETKRALERAVELEPKNPEYVFNLLQYHVLAPWPFGNESTAISLNSQLHDIDPRWGAAADGLVAAKSRDVEKAQTLYLVAWDHGKGVSQILQPLVYNSLSLEDWPTARTVLGERLRQDPNHQFSLYYVGLVVALSGEALGEGRDALERYVAIEHYAAGVPPKAAAYWRLGQLHLELDDPDAARAAWLTGITFDDSHEGLLDALRE